ncbi:hypothetical protein C8Q76DRAFT_347469 [Earliella scabrosa]|nr:hypothetical protein C8Q76DRAFT_347469 [Earliella scabrosa]
MLRVHPLLALALSTLAISVHASPSREPKVSHFVEAIPVSPSIMSIVNTFPVVDVTSAAVRAKFNNGTLNARGPVTGPIPGDFPAYLILFSDFSCTGTAFSIDMSTVPFDTCINAPIFFNSVAILQPTDDGLSFAPTVGVPGCAKFFWVSATNICFNVNENFTYKFVQI